MTAEQATADATAPPAEESAVPAVEAAPLEPTQWGLSPSDRRFLTILATVVLLLTVMHLIRSYWSSAPLLEVRRLESRKAEFQIDINHATWVEWMQLPGIGETMARQIVADREERGPFTSIDDVSRVKGIGPLRLREMRPHLRLDGAAEVPMK